MKNKDSGMIKVSIVEDNKIFRQRLAELLGFYENIEQGFLVESGELCLEYLDKTPDRPDVILMDIELPGISGIETTYRLKEKYHDIEVIMFTVFEDDERIFESVKVGASGYLLKDEGIDDVVKAIHETAAGGSPISPSIARKVLQMVNSTGSIQKPDGSDRPGKEVIPFGLTPAEVTILKQVVSGKTNKEIAEFLHLSPWTVKTHVRNIYRKMEVNSRASAVRKALKRDI